METQSPIRFVLPCGSETIIDADVLGRRVEYWTRAGRKYEFTIGDMTWRRKRRGNFDYVISRSSDQGYIFLHRAIVEATAEEVVDHASRFTLDNRRLNLRRCNAADNAHNKPSPGGISRFKGVVKDKRCPFNPWCYQIRWFDGIKQHLWKGGYCATEEEAARLYDRMARILYGEFAYLNFGTEPPPLDLSTLPIVYGKTKRSTAMPKPIAA